MRQEYLNAQERAARGRIAMQRRWHPDQPELVADDEALLAAARAERPVRRLVQLAGGLTREQRIEVARRLLAPDPEREEVDAQTA